MTYASQDFDAASHQRTPVEFTELLTDSDNQPSDNRTGNGGEPSQNEHWERLERNDFERERNVRARTPHDAGGQRHQACGKPYDDPDLFERNADRQGRAVAVRDRAQRAADACPLEKYGQRRNHKRGYYGRRDVDFLKGNETACHLDIDRARAAAEADRQS